MVPPRGFSDCSTLRTILEARFVITGPVAHLQRRRFPEVGPFQPKPCDKHSVRHVHECMLQFAFVFQVRPDLSGRRRDVVYVGSERCPNVCVVSSVRNCNGDSFSPTISNAYTSTLTSTN